MENVLYEYDYEEEGSRNIVVSNDEEAEENVIRFYRYESPLGYHSKDLDLRTFRAIKETPKGYHIVPEISFTIYTELNMDKKRWVSKDARKRYAYPTKKEALNSFQHRKIAQLKILARQIHTTRNALRLANNESERKFTIEDEFYKNEIRMADKVNSNFVSTKKVPKHPIFSPNFTGSMGFLTEDDMNL